MQAVVPQNYAQQRLDKVLAQLFPTYSRNQLQHWIDEGRITVDGMPLLAFTDGIKQIRQRRYRVLGGELIELQPGLLPKDYACAPEPVDLPIFYKDQHLLILNKKPGVVVHPGTGNWSGTLLNGLLYRYPDALYLPRAGIVHRLDKDTSGLMVVARSLNAYTHLVRQLQARQITRQYWALVWGAAPSSGTIEAAISRDSRNPTRMTIVDKEIGKPAITHFKKLKQIHWQNCPISLLLCTLETGRTHQIRLHLSYLGYPLLGEPVYRAIKNAYQPPVFPQLPNHFARQALHAWVLSLLHPHTRVNMSWQAPIPEDLQNLWSAFGLND